MLSTTPRLCFFVEKKADGSWKNHFFKGELVDEAPRGSAETDRSSSAGFYEKDKATPVDPRKVPKYDDEKLASFPEGYREFFLLETGSSVGARSTLISHSCAGYLAYGQSAAYKIKMDLPQTRGEEHDHFYSTFIDWLNGDSIESMKVKLGV